MPKLCDGSVPKESPCCGDKVAMSLADGVLTGSCWKCGKAVVRINPRTKLQELLEDEPPWTSSNAEGSLQALADANQRHLAMLLDAEKRITELEHEVRIERAWRIDLEERLNKINRRLNNAVETSRGSPAFDLLVAFREMLVRP